MWFESGSQDLKQKIAKPSAKLSKGVSKKEGTRGDRLVRLP